MNRRPCDESSEIDCLVGKDTYACNVTETTRSLSVGSREGTRSFRAAESHKTMKTRVLLAEDDAHVGAFMAEALRFLGFEVTVAGDGEKALAKAAESEFEVVMTDHRMPGMDGLGLVRALRTRGFGGRIYVASGVLSAHERASYEVLKVDGIASKPLALAELNGLLRGFAEFPPSGQSAA